MIICLSLEQECKHSMQGMSLRSWSEVCYLWILCYTFSHYVLIVQKWATKSSTWGHCLTFIAYSVCQLKGQAWWYHRAADWGYNVSCCVFESFGNFGVAEGGRDIENYTSLFAEVYFYICHCWCFHLDNCCYYQFQLKSSYHSWRLFLMVIEDFLEC